jgi:hypothetical protein
MKRTLLALAILATLAGNFGCQRVTPKVEAAAVVEQKPTKDASDKAVYYCEAIKPDGTRCKRHVNEDGLLCWQHSAMVKAGKKVRTIR